MADKVVIIEEKSMLGKNVAQIELENQQFEREMQIKKEQQKMTVMTLDNKTKSINIGVVGVGQCGGKIAEEFYKRGYDVVAINTALQDLKPLQIPEGQKMMLDVALGGAAKDLDTGEAAAVEYADEILGFLKENFEENDVLLLATSSAGGTGAGSAETMAKIMSQLERPIATILVLPNFASEDSLAKHNALHTLSKLASLAKNDVINSLIIVDNTKIDLLYPNLSIAKFYRKANEAIVEPLHLFNELSSNPSEYGSLDPMDFAKVFIDEGDCSLYGMIEVEDYMEEEAIAEAILENMENGLLASDFNLETTRAVGVIVTGSPEMLEEIPAVNLEYGFSMVNKVCSEGTKVFRGVYAVDGQENLRVYSLFSGLGLPEERVEELRKEAERHMANMQKKESSRATNMNIDIGKSKTVSAADAIHKKIKGKKSAMGKIKNNSKRLVDRRRK